MNNATIEYRNIICGPDETPEFELGPRDTVTIINIGSVGPDIQYIFAIVRVDSDD